MKNEPIATLCIDQAWVDEKDKSLIAYNLVDPDDVDHVLVTPRSSKLGKLLLKEIKEVESEKRALDQEVKPVDVVTPWLVGAPSMAVAPDAHPYGSAGDDTSESSTTPPVARSFLAGRYRGGVQGGGVSPW